MDEQSSLFTALAVTLDGIADADERQQVREYIKQLELERSELRAKLALVDTFAQWKRNAPKGSLTFAEWLARREDIQPRV